MSDVEASPLTLIERNVQDRAKRASLELDRPDGEAALRRMIDGEISQWQDDHRRGQRAVALSHPEQVAERTFRNIARYGPLTTLLDDDDVWEIMINSPASIFVKRHAGPSGYHDEVFLDDDHVLRTLTKLLDRFSHRPPQARPGRGAAGRATRRRSTTAHRPRRHRPWWPHHGEHPEVHRGLDDSRPRSTRRARHAHR